MIPERLQALRAEMTKRGIDIYVVPTADFHESEYVGEYFKARAFMTGFTGSAGTAVITQEKAGLWTDGRYFVQAERQLDGSGVTLFRMAEEGVPTVDEYIEKELSEGGCVGVDGRVVNSTWGKKLLDIAEKKQYNRPHYKDAERSLSVPQNFLFVRSFLWQNSSTTPRIPLTNTF